MQSLEQHAHELRDALVVQAVVAHREQRPLGLLAAQLIDEAELPGELAEQLALLLRSKVLHTARRRQVERGSLR